MTEQTTQAAPWARTAGAFYVGTIVTGVFSAYFVRSLLVVRGDAVATAQKILASESLFRLGIAAELIGILCYVAVTAILYDMLKPVNRNVSRLAAFLSLVGCAVGAANLLNDLAPLLLLQGASYLSVFTAGQLQALTYFFLRLDGQVNAIGLLFFAFYCMTIGGLIFKSTFLPRIVGVLMMVSGASWLLYNFAVVLSPAIAARLFFLPFAGIVGEASLTVWLLVMSVDVPKWRQASSRVAVP